MKDKKIKDLISKEAKRQKSVINLIASENYVSADVLSALGSVLTNKYSEGYPKKRYYGGNSIIDQIEMLCQKRALKLFGLNEKEWAVNVQALSGSAANLGAFVAGCPLGGKVMGMKLSSGGHLTHGQKVSFSGKAWKSVGYEVEGETELLDYSKLEKMAKKEKPDLIVAGFTAYPRIVDFKKFRKIADACNALLMVDMAHIAGLVAGKVYPSPFEFADIVTTTTHKTLRGPRSGMIFAKRGLCKKGPRKGEDLSVLVDKAVFPALQGGPHQNQIAAVAVALFEASTKEFRAYAKQVVKNAVVLAGELKKLGWRIITDGTDSHLILVDTWMNGQGLSGAEASERLEKAGIIVNKNTIPHDPRGPFDPSGIRLGTPAETTLGKKEKDMLSIARKIDKVLRANLKAKK